jgi:NTE family protein
MDTRGTTGLVLPGGGARAAYQVGVLKAVVAISGAERLPFDALAGISAGSINVAGLAQRVDKFADAVAHLESLWSDVRTGDVFEVDVRRMQGIFSQRKRPLALLDNTPLARLLERHVDRPAIQRAVARGRLRGVAVTASNTTTGEATTFVEANPGICFWHHDRRDSVAACIGAEHLLASSALPILFPAQRVAGEYFVDGSLRMTAPLSPAINLGASRILVIGVRHEALAPPAAVHVTPGLGEIGGYALESLFAENLNADLERLQQINLLLDMIPHWRRNHSGRRRIEVMVMRPSEDIRALAARFTTKLPRALRLFLRTLGSWGSEWRLPSYLLFEGPFCRALMDLGFRDGMRHRAALESFFAGA